MCSKKSNLNSMKKIILIFLLFFMGQTVSAQYNKQYIYYMSQNSILDKQYYEAISLLTILIDADSVSRDGYFLRAIAKYNLNDLIGAEQDFSSALKINPVYVEAYQYRAITRSIMGNWDDAINDFKMAIRIRPDYTSTYYSRGVTFLMCQQFDNAIFDFNKFIRQNPKAMEAYLNRGSAYLMLKDTLSAFNDFNKAVEVAPRSGEALTRRGTIYTVMKKNKEARKDFDRAIYYDNKNKIAYFNRALINANDNKPVDAIRDFTSVIKIDSTNSLTYYNRAITRAQIGDFNKAMEDYDKVVELAPDNVLGYYNRASLSVKLGNYESALDDYSYAIHLYPDFANAYLARASVRYRLNDMVGSKQDNDIAEAKIASYKNKYKGVGGGDDFAIFADTSRTFNKMLSFDSNLGISDKVKDKNIDIKLLSLYKVIKTNKLTESQITENKRDKSVYNFFAESEIENVLISNSPVTMTREEVMNEKDSRQKDRGDGKTSPEVWKVKFEDAISWYSIKQYTSSINDLTGAIDDNPLNPFLYMNRSSVHCEMMEFVQSIGNSGQRFVIEADKTKELHTVKQVYDFNNALFDINYAISLNPNVAYFYYNRANINVLSGDMLQAIADYSKAVELDKRFAEAYYNRGLVQIYLKDDKKGYLDLSRAGELGLKNSYEIINMYMNREK